MIRFFKILSIIGLLTIVYAGCKHSKKSFIQRLDECVYNKRISYTEFYPDEIKYFDKTTILKYFKSDIAFDSSINIINQDSDLLYTFKDDSSKVVFGMFHLSKGKNNFHLITLDLKSNIFKFHNGIKINMTRSDFFNSIKAKETDCDTFDIDLKMQCAPNYLRFTFKDDKLKTIELKYPLL